MRGAIMLRLREQQFDFATALAGDSADFLDLVAKGSRVLPITAISVYQNNVAQGFTNALALTFPVLKRLVGEAYFRQLAGQFRTRHPSRSGNLSNIGLPLPDFLQQTFERTEYAYLADISRLEWLVHEVQCAAEAPRLKVDAFRAVMPASYDRLRLNMHPAVRLLQSAFPIVQIWQSNQPGADPAVTDLRCGGDQLLIARTPDGIKLHRLTPACYALAFAMAAGARLGDGYEAAVNAAGAFDLAQALHRLLEAGSFTQLLE